MTPEVIEAIAKAIIGIVTLLVPSIYLYVQVLKVRAEADEGWRRYREQLTGNPNLGRMPTRAIRRRRYDPATSPAPILDTTQQETAEEVRDTPAERSSEGHDDADR